MSKADELRSEAAKLRGEMQNLNAKAMEDENGSDEAVHRLRSEDLKVKAEELERKADDLEQQAKKKPNSSLF